MLPGEMVGTSVDVEFLEEEITGIDAGGIVDAWNVDVTGVTGPQL